MTAVNPSGSRSPVRSWPLLVIAVPASVAIWSGWVGLGVLTGFGPVNLLPGIGSGLVVNTAITLPIGVEAYAAYALRAWLAGSGTPPGARRFARWSAIGSLFLGAGGQVAYHLMRAFGLTRAPWPITALVSCLPVVTLGMAAALAHLLHRTPEEAQPSVVSAHEVPESPASDRAVNPIPDRAVSPVQSDPTSLVSTIDPVSPCGQTTMLVNPDCEPGSAGGEPARRSRNRNGNGTGSGSGNAELVARTIRTNPGASIAELARLTRLSPATIKRHKARINGSPVEPVGLSPVDLVT